MKHLIVTEAANSSSHHEIWAVLCRKRAFAFSENLSMARTGYKFLSLIFNWEHGLMLKTFSLKEN